MLVIDHNSIGAETTVDRDMLLMPTVLEKRMLMYWGFLFLTTVWQVLTNVVC